MQLRKSPLILSFRCNTAQAASRTSQPTAAPEGLAALASFRLAAAFRREFLPCPVRFQ
jgi:hypothetical protein